MHIEKKQRDEAVRAKMAEIGKSLDSAHRQRAATYGPRAYQLLIELYDIIQMQHESGAS